MLGVVPKNSLVGMTLSPSSPCFLWRDVVVGYCPMLWARVENGTLTYTVIDFFPSKSFFVHFYSRGECQNTKSVYD